MTKVISESAGSCAISCAAVGAGRFWIAGELDLKEKTFKAMAEIHPELENLRQLRFTLDKLKLTDLQVGSDGCNRCWLAPFSARTGRNQPSSARFIFGPAVWLRAFLIQPPPGWAIAYLDWEGQEAGIAAGLSRDPAMIEAYLSKDCYITFGVQAGLLPRGRPKRLMERCAGF